MNFVTLNSEITNNLLPAIWRLVFFFGEQDFVNLLTCQRLLISQLKIFKHLLGSLDSGREEVFLKKELVISEAAHEVN